jgi:hypothetical protein
MRGSRRIAAIPLLVTTLVLLSACGDAGGTANPPAEQKSDGLLRTQDLSNLDPSSTEEDKVIDATPSWPCSGLEEDLLRDAGWTVKSRTYSNADEDWALSTALWSNDGAAAAPEMTKLKAAVDACRTKGEDVQEQGFEDDWYMYQSFGKTKQLEGERGYTTAGDHLIAQVTLVGLDGHEPPRSFGDVMENSTRRAETVQQD